VVSLLEMQQTKIRKLKIYTTKDDVKNEMWVYKDGIYLPQGRSEVKELLRVILGNAYNAYITNLVLNKIEADTFIEQNDFFNNHYIDEVPVLNGILNVRTKTLSKFTPDKIFFNKLPVTFNPDAKCSMIDGFVGDVLANADDRLVFYEMGGFCLWKEYTFEKAFMLIGNGRNGKDKSIELIKKILGVENTCSVPLSAIVPDSFIISEFHNKMANLAGEISNKDLKDVTAFKGLTGRSQQQAPRKFLKPVTFTNYSKFIFACNDLPMVYEQKKAFWDRWVLLDYPFTFVSSYELDSAKDKTNLKLRDENIIQKITTPEEMSGLLNRFLEGLDRIFSQRGFSTTKGSDDIKQLWIRRSNSVMAFCTDKIIEQYDCYISKKEFRKRYSEYCKEHKIQAKSDFIIKRTLEDIYGGGDGYRDLGNSRWEYTWEGIKWKSSL
jgi:putative DNA primase/helicase